MSTRSGLPTAATYVFVNMIKKLRQDFAPKYFAAVFDVSGEVFRDERARAIATLRRWNSQDAELRRRELRRLQGQARSPCPRIFAARFPTFAAPSRRCAFPFSQAEGFEADDVIGTLAREAAEQQHEVFIVSGDKDMMQLVTPQVKILNPQKDNLILDPDKVTETLGVPPDKVVDVMALRGDSVDNIPGAPGIGDKGSVELIKEFGTVEAVLDRAAEVKRKAYRESLEQNRDDGSALKGTCHHRHPCAAAAGPGRDGNPAARPRGLPHAVHRARVHIDAPRPRSCGGRSFG